MNALYDDGVDDQERGSAILADATRCHARLTRRRGTSGNPEKRRLVWQPIRHLRRGVENEDR
jgi:hypothetical protein